MKVLYLLVSILALASSVSFAYDPSPLQDFCVAIQDPKDGVAIAGLSSQNPGVITIANALFKSNPPISDEVLTKAFQVDKSIIDYLQKQSWYDNN
ncbi:hypothetical protein RYX36_012499 [Vicia faba]